MLQSTCTSIVDGGWWLAIGNVKQLIRTAPPWVVDPAACLEHLAARALQLGFPDVSIEVYLDGSLAGAITIRDGKLQDVGLTRSVDDEDGDERSQVAAHIQAGILGSVTPELKRLFEDYTHAIANGRLTLRGSWNALAARCDVFGPAGAAWAADCRSRAETAPVEDGATLL